MMARVRQSWYIIVKRIAQFHKLWSFKILHKLPTAAEFWFMFYRKFFLQASKRQSIWTPSSWHLTTFFVFSFSSCCTLLEHLFKLTGLVNVIYPARQTIGAARIAGIPIHFSENSHSAILAFQEIQSSNSSSLALSGMCGSSSSWFLVLLQLLSSCTGSPLAPSGWGWGWGGQLSSQ